MVAKTYTLTTEEAARYDASPEAQMALKRELVERFGLPIDPWGGLNVLHPTGFYAKFYEADGIHDYVADPEAYSYGE